MLREELLVLKLQTVECSALAFGNNLSTHCRLLPHRFVHVPLFILLSNRRTRKRVKRGVDNDGRGARGGLVNVLGLHACSGLFETPLPCVGSVHDSVRHACNGKQVQGKRA
jgi:hypothetical protein